MLEVISEIPIAFDDGLDMERAILPRYYTWLPNLVKSSPSTSSNISQDCASNTTLLTNDSPFNSQQALIFNTKKPTITRQKSYNNFSPEHYYAQNLRHENGLGHSQLFLSSDQNTTLVDLKQLEPLVMDDPMSIEEGDILMGVQEPKDADDTLIKSKECQDALPESNYCQYEVKKTVTRQSLNLATQVLAALSVSLGSLVVGFCSGYSSPALPSMMKMNESRFEVTDTMGSWIGSVMPLSALVGGIVGGPLIEYLGRRNTILATAAPFISAGIVIGTAVEAWIVIIGRILSGFAVGIISLSLPVYLGETIQADVRGTLGLLPTAFGNIGILLAFVAGKHLNWANLAFLGACLPIPFALLMFLIPETPRWYISKGKTKCARKALQWLRGKSADVSEELASVEKIHVESEKNSTHNIIRELLTMDNLRPLLISLGLMLAQQLSGINAVIFYAETIFKTAAGTVDDASTDETSNDDTGYSSVIIGIVNFLSTFVATALIDRLGRKLLLYISSTTMIITLTLLGLYFHLKMLGVDVTNYDWIPLASLIIYVLGFSLGWGPIPWLMMGEILPANIRGPAASIATSFNWFCTFIVTKTFASISESIGQSATYWIYGGVCIVGLMFVIAAVPETSGRSLEEIEKGMKGPVRRMSAVVNIKPTPTTC